jgi:hypothetical protein
VLIVDGDSLVELFGVADAIGRRSLEGAVACVRARSEPEWVQAVSSQSVMPTEPAPRMPRISSGFVSRVTGKRLRVLRASGG